MVWRPAARSAAPVTAILVGSGEGGVSLSDSVRALLRAVLQANQRLTGGARGCGSGGSHVAGRPDRSRRHPRAVRGSRDRRAALAPGPDAGPRVRSVPPRGAARRRGGGTTPRAVRAGQRLVAAPAGQEPGGRQPRVRGAHAGGARAGRGSGRRSAGSSTASCSRRSKRRRATRSLARRCSSCSSPTTSRLTRPTAGSWR